LYSVLAFSISSKIVALEGIVLNTFCAEIFCESKPATSEPVSEASTTSYLFPPQETNRIDADASIKKGL
jgi:hypothetical protein